MSNEPTQITSRTCSVIEHALERRLGVLSDAREEAKTKIDIDIRNYEIKRNRAALAEIREVCTEAVWKPSPFE